jgi:hydroxymethylbilane synthase
MSGRELIIGTRGSRLAMEQARRVRERLSGPAVIRVIRTSGDRFQDKPLQQQDGVGFFTKEIEQELLAKSIDLAVHSLKDLPTVLADGLVLAAVLPRDEAGDLLLVDPGAHDPDKPFPVRSGGRVGTSSIRRQALLKAIRQDVEAAPIRGNVPTRVDKLNNGDFDAIVLARAGLVRLGLDPLPASSFDLNPQRWICAPGQGVIAVEARADDRDTLERLAELNDDVTMNCTRAERSLLVTYGGGCHAPFGAYAHSLGKEYNLFVAAPGLDGAFRVEGFQAAGLDQARSAAEEWIRSGCPVRSENDQDQWIARPARSWGVEEEK